MNMKAIGWITIFVFFISCSKKYERPITDEVIPKPSKTIGFDAYSSFEIVLSGKESYPLLSVRKALESLIANQQAEVNYADGLAPEEYRLEIADKIRVTTGSQKGYHRAIGTLFQLATANGGRLPKCEIEDKPRFSYRGMHLDVCRHMFSPDEIKRYLHFMAVYKYNTFHWHLTEDQGWRIEIKKYPRLQTVAAFRKETLMGHYNDQPQRFDGTPYGGFYTQTAIREIVAFADSLGIEVIPEIEMPGHSLAALAAYPELGCDGGPYEVATSWGVFDEVYCPTEATFRFLEGVIDEVVKLFPSKYIHIGGDECPKDSWKSSIFCQDLIRREGLKDEAGLQSYFIRRMEKYILSKGKKIIGWDEILEGGLAPNATVMSWRGETGGIEAAMQGHDVIMTPTTYCYFDYYQSERPDEPLAIGGYLPVERVYEWNPLPHNLDSAYSRYILGAQGNVWTEYIDEFQKVEYMAFNRLIALSETLWTNESQKKDFADFRPRFARHLTYWEDAGMNIANHLLDLKARIENTPESGSFIRLPGPVIGGPDGAEQLVTDSLVYLSGKHRYTYRLTEGESEGRPVTFDYADHLGIEAKMEMRHLPHPKYSASGIRSIINGVKGSDEKYGDLEWLGFEGEDCDVVLYFNEPVDIEKLSFRFFNGPGQWIYLPRSIRIGSSDGNVVESNINSTQDQKVVEMEMWLNQKQVDRLHIAISNFGQIPSGQPGAGHPAWLFVDEITIE